MATIDSQPVLFRTEADKADFKKFLEEDDGASFYTVNLYKYHQVARYDGSVQANLSGREAFDRFSTVMVRLLAQQASHPIFGSNWFDDNDSGWDRLVIVRYRSRRDIVKVFTSPDFALASKDKWAGIDQNARFLVQGLHIPALPFLLAVLFVALVATRGALKLLKRH